MTSIVFLFFLVPALALILIGLNLLLAPHKPYKEKDSSFECGFHSFLGQNRSQFSISFFLFGLLFLIFDLEIVLIYPFVVSGYINTSYGLSMVFVFLVILTVGFCYELGKKALAINSKQTNNIVSISGSVLNSYFDVVKYRPQGFVTKQQEMSMNVSWKHVKTILYLVVSYCIFTYLYECIGMDLFAVISAIFIPDWLKSIYISSANGEDKMPALAGGDFKYKSNIKYIEPSKPEVHNMEANPEGSNNDITDNGGLPEEGSDNHHSDNSNSDHYNSDYSQSATDRDEAGSDSGISETDFEHKLSHVRLNSSYTTYEPTANPFSDVEHAPEAVKSPDLFRQVKHNPDDSPRLTEDKEEYNRILHQRERKITTDLSTIEENLEQLQNDGLDPDDIRRIERSNRAITDRITESANTIHYAGNELDRLARTEAIIRENAKVESAENSKLKRNHSPDLGGPSAPKITKIEDQFINYDTESETDSNEQRSSKRPRSEDSNDEGVYPDGKKGKTRQD